MVVLLLALTDIVLKPLSELFTLLSRLDKEGDLGCHGADLRL